MKACAGFLIGTRAKENCSVTVNRQISWLKRLNKVVFWPWISSPRMQGALLVSQWEAVAGKRKRSAGLGCFAIYFLIGTTKAIDSGPDCRQKLVISHAGSRRGGVVVHPPARRNGPENHCVILYLKSCWGFFFQSHISNIRKQLSLPGIPFIERSFSH